MSSLGAVRMVEVHGISVSFLVIMPHRSPDAVKVACVRGISEIVTPIKVILLM